MAENIKSKETSDKPSRAKWLSCIPAGFIMTLLYLFYSMNTQVEVAPDNDIQESVPSEKKQAKLLSGFSDLIAKDYPKFHKNLKEFPDYYQDFIIQQTDNELIENLEGAKTLEEAVIILTKYVDPDFAGHEITSWLDWVERDLTNPTATWGGKRFHELDPHTQMSALATYLIRERHLKYVDKVTPAAYNMAKVIKNSEGLCATLPIVFTLICDRLKVPVHLVSSRQHVFCRYDDGKTKINIESTSPYAMGVGTPDEFYLQKEATGGEEITKHELSATSTMKSLNLRQSISVLLLNASAATVKQERFLENFRRADAKNEEELKNDLKYWTSSYYFNPKSYLATRNLLATVQDHYESFDYKFVHGLRSYAMRKGIIKGNEEDVRLMMADIEGLRVKHKDLLGMYGSFDMQDLEKVDKFKKETGTRLIQLYKYMKANKYLLNEEITKELTEIKLRYIRLYKWADVK